jgi:hypothetical protein
MDVNEDRDEESRGLTVAFSAWRFRVTRTQKTIYFPFRPGELTCSPLDSLSPEPSVFATTNYTARCNIDGYSQFHELQSTEFSK